MNVQPLFSDMDHPKQDQVGLLQPVTCGHNGDFKTNEI